MSVKKTKVVKPNGPPVLRVISGGVEHEVVPLAYVMKQFKRVLDAELAPGVTVEEACHIDLPHLGDDLRGLTFEVLLEHKNLMHAAGLGCSVNLVDAHDAIVLQDKKKFKLRFPELAHVIPLLLAYDGVMPYTNGRPREQQPLPEEQQSRGIW